MPYVPLPKHKQRNVEDNDGPENDTDVAPIFPKPISHAGQMAKRILQEARKKKEGCKRPRRNAWVET